MKNWKRIFRIITVITIIFCFAYVFFLVGVKDILAKKIEQLTGCKTTIGKLLVIPPLNLVVKNLEIVGLFKTEEIYLSPSILSFLFGKIVFNKIKIVKPELTYQRIPVPVVKDSLNESNILIEASQKQAVSNPVAVTKSEENKTWPLIIKSLKIKNGKLNFIDSTASSGTIKVLIKDLDFYISNVTTLQVNLVSKFSLNGKLSWNTGEPDGKIALDGWLNSYKKDIQATLKIQDIDAIVFYPYYSTWVDLTKARIEKAKLNFNSNVKGENNNIAAECHLELTDIVRKVRPADEPQQKAERLTDAVLDMFKSMNQGRVVLDFTLHTKMDRPEFGFGNIKSAFEGKIMQARAGAGLRPQDMLLWPGKMVRSGIKSGTNFTNAIVDGVVSLGTGVKKFFEDVINQPVPAN